MVEPIVYWTLVAALVVYCFIRLGDLRMTRRNPRKYAENVMEYVLPKAPKGYAWHLSCMNPGDGNRWQIGLVHVAKGHGWHVCLPEGHYPTRDFLDYLDGLREGLGLVDRIKHATR